MLDMLAMTTSYGYYDNTVDVLGLVLAIWGIVAVMMIIIYIPWVIGAWKIFEKAGEKGWKALIPIYNIVIFLQIAGLSPWWVLGTFVNPLNIFVSFYRNIKLAEKFNKGVGYGVLMAFFEPIMYLVLGFGSAEYDANATGEISGVSVSNEEYLKQREEYDKAYAKYEKEVEEYNKKIAKKEEGERSEEEDL